MGYPWGSSPWVHTVRQLRPFASGVRPLSSGMKPPPQPPNVPAMSGPMMAIRSCSRAGNTNQSINQSIKYCVCEGARDERLWQFDPAEARTGEGTASCEASVFAASAEQFISTWQRMIS